MKKNKKAVEMPFNWIFAAIAGAVILFLAVFFVGRFIGVSETKTSTETSAKLASLLDSLEIGLASGKLPEINFNKEVRIYFSCDYLEKKPFGIQKISFSEKNLGKYSEKGEEIVLKNKYIFTEDILDGKEVYIFSKPFLMPFKISDLIMISSKEYCFYQPPNNIKEDIENLNLKKIHISDNLLNCTGIKVCFDSGREECNIKVFGTSGSYDIGKVIHNNIEVYYLNNLIYPAIFSSPGIYECNIKRLISRFNELSSVYLDKLSIIEKKTCSSILNIKLEAMKSSAKSVNSSKDLILIYEQSKEIEEINKIQSSGCKLY